jgi:hypothetical protein
LFPRFYIWSGYKNWALNIENWGWFIEWTPAFIGSGMLIGLNSAISLFAGSVLAWGLIGPLLVHYGVCIGKAAGGDDPKWAPLMSFTSLSHIGEAGWTPSPSKSQLLAGLSHLCIVSDSGFIETSISSWNILHQEIAGRSMLTPEKDIGFCGPA